MFIVRYTTSTEEQFEMFNDIAHALEIYNEKVSSGLYEAVLLESLLKEYNAYDKYL